MLRMRCFAAIAAVACMGLLSPIACRNGVQAPAGKQLGEQAMADLVPGYVKLVLALGLHDPDYVDAYYGAPSLRAEAENEKLSLTEIREGAEALLAQWRTLPQSGAASQDDDATLTMRHTALTKQMVALIARIDMLAGKKFGFDEECALLYDAIAPHHGEAHFQAIQTELEALLPGEDTLPNRVQHFLDGFIIAPDKLDAVFQAAINEARKRTKAHIELPETESFRVEYVTGKTWSGYNWYQGNYQSLIQVNTDLPILIDRAVDLACHEGYPGHHVYNLLLEQHLVNGKGWLEFTVYPLFSPQSLIAEGSANFGIEVAFPGPQRVAFEREVLFPLAGLDPQTAETYYRVQSLLAKLKYAGNEAARQYLDGVIDGEEAVRWLTSYAMMSEPKARQRLGFIEQYRGYVINYNLGQDLVESYVAARGGTEDQPLKRWQIFFELLSNPHVPSDLLAR